MSNRTMIAPAAGAMLRLNAVWLAAVLLVVTIIYSAMLAGMATAADLRPVWPSVNWFLHWAALVGGVGLARCLSVLVAHGLTRRTALVAGAVALLALAAGMAVFVQAGLLVESAVFRAAGQVHNVDGAHMFVSAGQVHLVLAEYGLQFAGFLVTGWLIFAVYQRAGAWWGTLALPLTAIPAVGAMAALSAAWIGGTGADLPWVATMDRSTAVALAVAAVLAGLLAIRFLSRTIPIRTR